MYIETHLTPRFSDTDAMGHINNTAVTQWLEAGRMDFYLNHLQQTPSTMLRRIEVDYDREMNFRQDAVIRTGVERIGNTSATLRQEIWQGGNCCVKAIAVDVFFDPQTRRAAEIPALIRELFEQHIFVG